MSSFDFEAERRWRRIEEAPDLAKNLEHLENVADNVKHLAGNLEDRDGVQQEILNSIQQMVCLLAAHRDLAELLTGI